MHQRSILLVDDEPDILKVGRLALERLGGFCVRVAGSGEDALASVVASRPDAVLLDAMMPTMDGTETLARLRETVPGADLPVIFVTAKVQRADIERFLASGAVGVIAKPFDPISLAQQIKEILKW